ncbi:MAG: fused MFS/spermidine synthase [Rhodococcus sp. (in: high G+C Gram-positive bacteria)]
MANKKPKPQKEQRGPVAGVYRIDTGTVELVRDTLVADGWTIEVNGVPSSHIDMDDPMQLDFEYMRWISGLVRYHSFSRLRALHLGGGACTLARSFAAEYPDARQVVVELDGTLAELAREWFDLPRAPLLRIRVGEARAVTETLTEDSRDLVVRDVFAGTVTPGLLLTAEFTEHVRRVLAPGGVYVVNCGDTRDLSMAKREAATIGSIFPHTVMIADPAMLKGRRYGNVVIAGSDVSLGGDPGLARELLGGGVPAQVWDDERVRAFARDAKVLRDADG